jgi:hypothetical protein
MFQKLADGGFAQGDVVDLSGQRIPVNYFAELGDYETGPALARLKIPCLFYWVGMTRRFLQMRPKSGDGFWTETRKPLFDFIPLCFISSCRARQKSRDGIAERIGCVLGILTST